MPTLLSELIKNSNKSVETIATETGLTPNKVRYEMRKLGISPFERLTNLRSKGLIKSKNSVHSHLTKEVMIYFMTHSWQETMEYFGLSQRQLKSLFTFGYRRPEYKHLRKDDRCKREWDIDDIIFMIRHSGFKSRNWIAKELDRGSFHAVKDRLSLLNISDAKMLNGIGMTVAKNYFNLTIEGYSGNAGPSIMKFVIVPWVTLDEIKDDLSCSDEIKTIIKIMAMFQRWIFGCDSNHVLSKIEKIIKS